MVKQSYESLIAALDARVTELESLVNQLANRPHPNSIREGWTVASMAKEIGYPGNSEVMDALRVHARSFSKKNNMLIKINGTQRKVEFFCDPAAEYAMKEVKILFED